MRQAFQVLRDTRFRTKLFLIAIPVALQNLINFGVSAADTIMVGQLGEVQLSAVAVSNQFSFLYMIISFGVSGGCGVLAAQYWGAGDKARVRQIFAFMYRIMTVVTLLFASLALFIPEHVLGFIIDDAEVIAEGVRYLRIMGISYLFFGFTTATIGVLRSTGVVKIGVMISLNSLVISVVLNYGLIFGNFGLPALGVMGAAIATSIARFLELAVLLVYLLRMDRKIGLRLRDLFRRTEGIAERFLKHSAPVLLNEIGWATGNFFLGVIVGRMGREFVAANSIAMLLNQFVLVVVFGVSSAAATIIGNTIGEGDELRAKRYANGLIAVSVLLGVFSFFLIQAVRLPLINVYDISETAQGYARQITHVLSVSTILHSVVLVAILGILRGGGDTRFTAIVDVASIWVVAPLGAIAGLWLGAPVVVVFLIFRSEDVFKMALIAWRLKCGQWIRDVTKT